VSDDADITADARARVFRAILQPEWTIADLKVLAALIELGPPSALHAGFPDVPGEHELDPAHGNVPAMRRAGGAPERARADVLHAYRTIAQPLKLMPPPGNV
jgi:hypothetical protein